MDGVGDGDAACIPVHAQSTSLPLELEGREHQDPDSPR